MDTSAFLQTLPVQNGKDALSHNISKRFTRSLWELVAASQGTPNNSALLVLASSNCGSSWKQISVVSPGVMQHDQTFKGTW